MAARPRSLRHRGYPDNLYESRGYFTYRNPETGISFGIGRDKNAAFQQAQETNIYLAGLKDKPRLIDRVTGDSDRTLHRLLDLHDKVLERQHKDEKRSVVTRRQDKWKKNTVQKHAIAKLPVKRLEDDPRPIGEFIAEYYDDGKERMAQSFHSYLTSAFQHARGLAWIKVNPAEAIAKITGIRVKRARLTFDAFKIILAAAEKHEDPWVANSMLLGLVSAQRREDVGVFMFKNRPKATAWLDEGFLWVKQPKEGVRVRIPLSLRLDAIGMSLDDVVKRCRDRVLSDYLVHHTQNYGNAPAGSAVHIDTITRHFAVARDLSGLVWPELNDDGKPQTPPTYHEIRSLAERLYAEQGIDTQVLLGHKDPASTQRYKDKRGVEWTEVKVA